MYGQTATMVPGPLQFGQYWNWRLSATNDVVNMPRHSLWNTHPHVNRQTRSPRWKFPRKSRTARPSTEDDGRKPAI
eukprot:7691290-Lingulodinium_polyedra.AAC.1